MFDVLAFVYENYWAADRCPEMPALQRTLNAVGFADHEVISALLWLEELKYATREVASVAAASTTLPPEGLPSATQRRVCRSSEGVTRLFSEEERDRLGVQGWGLLVFLTDAGALDGSQLELVLERVLATPGNALRLEDLKLVVLMVYWSLCEEPDALLLDELCDNGPGRLAN